MKKANVSAFKCRFLALFTFICIPLTILGQSNRDHQVRLLSDQNQVELAQRLRVEIRVSGDPKEEAKLTVPDSVDMRYSGQGSSIKIVNMSYSKETIYYYDLSFSREGKFTIGPAVVAFDNGQATSNTIEIIVVINRHNTQPMDKNQLGIAEIIQELSDEPLYIRQPALICYYLLVENASMLAGLPQIRTLPKLPGAIVEEVENWSKETANVYVTQDDKTLLKVPLIAFRIYPVKVGDLIMENPQFVLRVKKAVSVLGYFRTATTQEQLIELPNRKITSLPLPIKKPSIADQTIIVTKKWAISGSIQTDHGEKDLSILIRPRGQEPSIASQLQTLNVKAGYTYALKIKIQAEAMLQSLVFDALEIVSRSNSTSSDAQSQASIWQEDTLELEKLPSDFDPYLARGRQYSWLLSFNSSGDYILQLPELLVFDLSTGKMQSLILPRLRIAVEATKDQKAKITHFDNKQSHNPNLWLIFALPILIILGLLWLALRYSTVISARFGRLQMQTKAEVLQPVGKSEPNYKNGGRYSNTGQDISQRANRMSIIFASQPEPEPEPEKNQADQTTNEFKEYSRSINSANAAESLIREKVADSMETIVQSEQKIIKELERVYRATVAQPVAAGKNPNKAQEFLAISRNLTLVGGDDGRQGQIAEAIASVADQIDRYLYAPRIDHQEYELANLMMSWINEISAALESKTIKSAGTDRLSD